MSTLSATSLDEAEHVRSPARARRRRMAASERQAEAVVAAAFVLAAVALAVVRPATRPASHSSRPHPAWRRSPIASRVSFDVGAGFTVPTQIAFVPMLLSLPPSLLAPLTVLALAIGLVPDVVAGRMPASRLLVVPGNSWFAIGPAIVLAATGDQRRATARCGCSSR